MFQYHWKFWIYVNNSHIKMISYNLDARSSCTHISKIKCQTFDSPRTSACGHSHPTPHPRRPGPQGPRARTSQLSKSCMDLRTSLDLLGILPPIMYHHVSACSVAEVAMGSLIESCSKLNGDIWSLYFVYILTLSFALSVSTECSMTSN